MKLLQARRVTVGGIVRKQFATRACVNRKYRRQKKIKKFIEDALLLRKSQGE